MPDSIGATSPASRPPAAVPITPEVVVRRQLTGGAVALVRESRATSALTVRGYLPAGAIREPAGREGLALLTASLLTRGTALHTSESLALTLDSLGASLSVRADVEGVSFGVRCLSEDAGRMLDLLAEVLIRPTFPADETEKQRAKLITGIRESRHDTRAMADKAFRAAAFPLGHPYHRPLEGEEETVAALTRDQLADFHRRWYRPHGTVLAVVGDVEAAEAVARLEGAFAGWQAGPSVDASPVPPAGPAASVQRSTVAIPGKTQADIVLGVPGFSRTSPDYYPAMMADLILGRLGLMGRLGATLRDEEGLAYYVYSQAQAGFLAGPWAVRAGVNPKNVDRTIAGILREIGGLHREPVRGSELEDARDYLVGSLAIRLETDAGIGQALLEIELFELGLDYLLRYPSLIRSVTPEQIGAAAARYLRLDGYTVATAVPA
ncbi:MAG TPA: pitrilysin family protein [bacterium]|nr:pitrilysin family protein [bacterium]